jgi:hypothetical protein
VLARANWNADMVRDELRAYIIQHLGEPHGVLVLDETGWVKKGATLLSSLITHLFWPPVTNFPCHSRSRKFYVLLNRYIREQ